MGFRVVGIGSVSPGRDDNVGVSLFEEFERMIQTGFQNRRRPAVVLCRAEYDDDVHVRRIVADRGFTNAQETSGRRTEAMPCRRPKAEARRA